MRKNHNLLFAVNSSFNQRWRLTYEETMVTWLYQHRRGTMIGAYPPKIASMFNEAIKEGVYRKDIARAINRDPTYVTNCMRKNGYFTKSPKIEAHPNIINKHITAIVEAWKPTSKQFADRDAKLEKERIELMKIKQPVFYVMQEAVIQSRLDKGVFINKRDVSLPWVTCLYGERKV